MQAGATPGVAVLDELAAAPTDVRCRGSGFAEGMTGRQIPIVAFEFEREEFLFGRTRDPIEVAGVARKAPAFSFARSASPHAHRVPPMGRYRRHRTGRGR